MSTTPLPSFELWPAQGFPGEWIFVPDGTDGGGVVVGRVWKRDEAADWYYGQASAGCGDRRWHTRESRQEAAEAVIQAWLDAGQPDARKAAEAAADG